MRQKLKSLIPFPATLLLFLLLHPASIRAQQSIADFPLSAGGHAASILIDPNDSQTVILAAKLFAEDVERVCGIRPAVVSNISGSGAHCVIIGSLESSALIRRLVEAKKLDVSEIEGAWESCQTEVINNPLPGIKRALVIAGSDRRGTAYGVFELSKQIGVSPWYYFADVPVKKSDRITIKSGRYLLNSPSVKYRGIFINDEMWGLRPWAMYTHAPHEGKGIGPSTHRKIFELLLRLKANMLWPAMHQQTKPFNYYPENKVVADQYGIIMGSSHIEPMLRNNIGGAEWDTEYPGESWDYVNNRDHIYQYWEKRILENGSYENIYTLGKRGKDDEAGSDITVEVLERIFSDQRQILAKWVDRDVTGIPQVLIPYTEVLGLYNQGLKVPEDVIICWPDDNFGNIRQLPDHAEQQRPGGSGVYYHFQWLNGATSAYTWTCTTPLVLTWFEMKKAWDFGARKLWVVNVGDIKPAEINIEYFMQLAWNVDGWDHSTTFDFPEHWAGREFGDDPAKAIGRIMNRHYELGYARRPEHMVLWNGARQELSWEWFSLDHYGDEAQRRIDAYSHLIQQVDSVYCTLPSEMKDAFFQTVVYNVKGTALQNLKVLYAQKSHTYGEQRRASAAVYAAKAQEAENGIHALIGHYNRGLLTVGAKWDHMASLPGPWGGQWRQWDMPPLSSWSGEGVPAPGYRLEGGDSLRLPELSVHANDSVFIDLFNTGNGAVYWSLEPSDRWIKASKTSGVIYDEERIWVKTDRDEIRGGSNLSGSISIYASTSLRDEWAAWDQLSVVQREAFKQGSTRTGKENLLLTAELTVFNPNMPGGGAFKGFIETRGSVSIEAENFSRKTDHNGGWEILKGLGRTGSSITVLPVTSAPLTEPASIYTASPTVEYDVYLFSAGKVKLHLHCIPGYAINREYRQRVAVSFNDQEPQVISPVAGSRNVMDNLMTFQADLDLPAAGAHVLKIRMVDPGIVIDKIILDTGGLKKTYLGPPEK